MFRRRSRQCSGQLALMDAIVFFLIAIAISSMLLYYSRGELFDTAAVMFEGQSDPEAILRVFLHASVGEAIVLNLEGGKHISANTEVSECLRTELDALARGSYIQDFDPLNDELVGILRATCSPVLEPFLTVILYPADSLEPILEIPGKIPDSANRYAASTRLPGVDGSDFLLALVLVPASSLEILDVRACDLYFRSSEGQSSANFQPREYEHEYEKDDCSIEIQLLIVVHGE